LLRDTVPLLRDTVPLLRDTVALLRGAVALLRGIPGVARLGGGGVSRLAVVWLSIGRLAV
jgi:hypothetical protein